VISVGSGLAGVASALAAADSGMETILLEKSDLLGGSTAHSYGILWVPNNHLEKGQGIEDSADLSRRYMLWLGGERQSLEHVDAYLRYAPEALEYFERVGDIPFYPIGLSDHFYPVADGTLEFGRNIQVKPFDASQLGEWQPRLRHSRYLERITWDEMKQWGGRANERNWDHVLLAEREANDIRTFGAGLVGHFLRAAIQRGVNIWNSTSVDELVVEDGRVTGISCSHEGQQLNIRAKRGVILGTGLYGANERLVGQLVPVLDDLERALEAAAEHEEAKLEEGVRLVQRALADALGREGLAEIPTDGKFDPHTQEALLSQSSDAEEGTVIQVLQKGYTLGDRVLRPARVVISSGADG